MKYATSWNVVKGLGVVGLRCPNHSLGGIALWRRAVGFTALPWRGGERPPDAGSRSVARREKGARLASGACSRRGCFCSFALAVLAVLAVLATAAPEQAAAQTVTTFLSNTGQSANTSTNTVRATAFTTGTGTYTLSSVAIYSPIQSTSPTPLVQIYGDASGNPGTLVATMTNPATVADSTLNVFTAPANTTLAASTTYWLVTSNSASTFGTDFRVATNNNNNVDSGTAAGWTIGNGLYKTDVRLAPWTNSSNRHRFEIRGTEEATTNAAPTVTNPIPDQTATAGTAFSYQFPANTFNDTDTGDTLSYTATKADDTALPTWLAFTDSTRTFAGTPAVADTGTVSVKVTASDGNGGSISDEFDITVRAATTTPTAAASLVSNLGQTQHSGSLPLNSWDVVQGFETGASGYTLVSVDLRLNRQSGGTSIAVPSVKLMEGTKTATSVTLTGQPVTLTAEVAQVTSTTGENYTFTAPSGTTLSASTRYFLVVERVGTRVQWMTTASTGEDAPPASAAGWSIDDERWRRSASDTANFTGKVARSQLLRVNGNTNTSTNAAPTVPNAIPDQTATAGTAFSYAFPDSTFNDTDTGDTLSYTATKADGMTLPTWLVFTDSARTFAGTPVVADTGTVSVKVTASDGNGGSVSDTFDITVTPTPFVSNTGQTTFTSSVSLPDLDAAQEFTTGDNSAGYTLSSIEVRLQNVGPVTTNYPTVKVFSGSATGTEVAALTAPSADGVNGHSNYVYTAPANVTLDSATSYWVVYEGSTSRVSTTSSTAEDATPASGWSIADNLENRVAGSTVSFTSRSGFALQIRVHGSVRDPNADTTPPTLTSATVTANGTAILLGFSETVSGSAARRPPNSAFTVTADGIAVPAQTGLVGIGLALTLSPVSIRQGQAVVITYTDPTTGDDAKAAQDAAGNDAASFTTGMNSVPAVTNSSTLAAVAPNAPTSLTATASGTTTINLSWTAPVDNGGSAITGYKIEISPNGTSNWTNQVANTASTTTTYEHTGLAASTTRHYRVSAINSIGTSTPSDVANATTGTAANNAPTVTNPIPDQTATAGTGFSYQFPANSFNDTDTGDTLSYTATKADGMTLPTWLAFTDSTRTFAGTPVVADTGTVSVKVTANDSNGGLVSDTFDIMVVNGAGICARTAAVRDALLAKITGVTDCALVTDTHLAAITGALLLNAKSITVLAAGDFDGLTALTGLDLEDNSLTALPAGVFDELTALTTLNLFGNSLTALPAGVFDKLTALTELSLADNSLTGLPAGVFDELTALTTLLLSANSLTALPAGVFDGLTALTGLYLSRNSLTALPAGVFDGLTALTELSLSANSLTALPAGVFDGLTALTVLNLEYNSLAALPAGVFDGLTALTVLHLEYNSLAELPDDVFEPLTSLTTLDLSGNPGAPFRPTAVALPDDGTVPAAGGTVMLDGSGSGGAWGTNVTYAWALTTPTTGVTVTFDNDSIAKPTVTIPPVTTGTDLVFTLTVTGRPGDSALGISTGTDTAAVTTTTGTTGTTAPGAPTDLTATASGSTTINLTWTAPASNGGSAITGYKIEVSSDGGSSWTDRVANTNSTATTYAHSGLAVGTTRHYRVSAINTNGTGLPSDVDDATTDTVIDTRPPVLTQATVNGGTLVLTYDETLDGASVPAAGAFAVTAAGNAVTVNGVSVGGSAVTLTLANAVQANQTVTLDYTPGASPIQDGAGNDAAALSGQAVTNNTPRVSIGPWLLSVSEGVGDAVLTVSLDRPAASALSVAWHTQEETANAPDDYTASEGPVTFAAGESQKTISVPIVDDAVQEDAVNDVHELFFVILSPGEGYTLADNPLADSSAAIVEIVDNDGVGSGDAANDALALVDGVTPEVAAAVLLGEQTLSEAQLAALDRLGNRNGRYDLGDLLSWIARCRRGEARCGSSSTDSGPGSAAMLGAAAAGSRSTPKRPGRRDSGRRGRSSTGGIRRRARMAGHALAILLAATMTWSCTEGGLVGPVAAPPDPGFLTVEWSGPATNRDAGVLLEFEGPTIDAVRAPGLELYESSAPGPHRIVVAGVLRPGPLVQFRVPDRNQFALYRVRVLQVTGEDYGLRDVGEYQAVITVHR